MYVRPSPKKYFGKWHKWGEVCYLKRHMHTLVLIDFSLTVKAATFIFISGRGPAKLSTKEGKSGFIYNRVKS